MLIQNALRIKERGKPPVFIASLHTHDFRPYTFSNGQIVAVDGGHDYVRRVTGDAPKGTKVEDYCLDEKCSWQKIRARLLWGTYGRNCDKPLKFVRLCRCSTNHLRAIKRNVQGINPIHMKVIESVLKARSKAKAKTQKRSVRKPINKKV